MSNLFECKDQMPPAKNGDAYADSFPTGPGGEAYKPPQYFPAGSSIAVTMTPRQERELRMSNYPGYDAMCVENVGRPRFGKKV